MACAIISVLGLVHWDFIINKINTSSSIQASVDVGYLLTMQNPDVIWLDRYFTNNPQRAVTFQYVIQDQIETLTQTDTGSWKSWPNNNETYVKWLNKWYDQARTTTQLSVHNVENDPVLEEQVIEYASSHNERFSEITLGVVEENEQQTSDNSIEEPYYR